MTHYTWADGFQPPSGVSAEAVKNALDELAEPSPDNLLDASKTRTHILHGDLWSEGDQAWAQRARLDRCRRIIGAVHEVVVVGGKTLTTRSVEFVRPNGSPNGRWCTLQTIMADPVLIDALMDEVIALQERVTAKLARIRELMKQARQAGRE